MDGIVGPAARRHLGRAIWGHSHRSGATRTSAEGSRAIRARDFDGERQPRWSTHTVSIHQPYDAPRRRRPLLGPGRNATRAGLHVRANRFPTSARPARPIESRHWAQQDNLRGGSARRAHTRSTEAPLSPPLPTPPSRRREAPHRTARCSTAAVIGQANPAGPRRPRLLGSPPNPRSMSLRLPPRISTLISRPGRHITCRFPADYVGPPPHALAVLCSDHGLRLWNGPVVRWCWRGRGRHRHTAREAAQRHTVSVVCPCETIPSHLRDRGHHATTLQ
jgi:hypothetical protein